MASQTKGSNTIAFDFDKWIINNGLTDIKQVFIDNNMHNLLTLTTNNQNFASLITDKRIMQRLDLQSTIITSIQSLLPLQIQHQQPSQSFIILSQTEQETMTQIKKYIQDINNLYDEYNKINDKYQIKKLENTQIMDEYQKQSLTKIDEIENDITMHIQTIYKTIQNKHKEVNHKINSFKQQQIQINTEQTEHIHQFDEKCNDISHSVKSQKEYSQQLITKCNDIFTKYSQNNNYGFIINEENKEREKEILESAKHLTTKHEQEMNEFISFKQDANEFIKHPIIPTSNNTMNSIMAYNEIFNDIKEYIASVADTVDHDEDEFNDITDDNDILSTLESEEDDENGAEEYRAIIQTQDIEYDRAFNFDATDTPSINSNPFAKNPFDAPNKLSTSNADVEDENHDIKREKNAETIDGDEDRVRLSANMDKWALDTNVNGVAFCKYYGSAVGCKNEKCGFSHENPNSVTLCKWFESKWGCKYGSKCKHRHEQFEPYKPVQGEESDCDTDDVEEIGYDEDKVDEKEFVFNKNAAEFIPSCYGEDIEDLDGDEENGKKGFVLNGDAAEFVPSGKSMIYGVFIEQEIPWTELRTDC